MAEAIDTADVVNLKSSLVRNTLPGTEGTYHRSVSSVGLCDFEAFAERVFNSWDRIRHRGDL